MRQNMMTATVTAGGKAASDMFVRFKGMSTSADTPVATGASPTVDTPLGSIAPVGDTITAEIYRRKGTSDILVTTVTWAYPFERTEVARTVAGVKHGVTLELVRR